MFFVGEYVGIVMVSGLLVTLFFGGWLGPFSCTAPVHGLAESLQMRAAACSGSAPRLCFFMCLFILLRAALAAAPRYDHMLAAGWKVLPAAGAAQPAGHGRRRNRPQVTEPETWACSRESSRKFRSLYMIFHAQLPQSATPSSNPEEKTVHARRAIVAASC